MNQDEDLIKEKETKSHPFIAEGRSPRGNPGGMGEQQLNF